jgi:hypothetical protein
MMSPQGPATLSIPVTVKNSSLREIEIRLPHEGFARSGPGTDLYVALEPGDEKKLWSDGPGYLAGPAYRDVNPVRLSPGETRIFNVVLNSLVTGSIPTHLVTGVLMPGRYSIKFLMFFTIDGSKEYVESEPAEIEVGR